MSGWRIPPLLWIHTKLFPTFVWRLNFVLKLSWLPWFPIRNDCPSVDECKHISCRCLSLSCFDGWLCQGRGGNLPPSLQRPQHQHPPTCPNWQVSFTAPRARRCERALAAKWQITHICVSPCNPIPVHSVQISCRHTVGALELRRRNQTTAESFNGEASSLRWRERNLQPLINGRGNDKTFLTDSIRLINKKIQIKNDLKNQIKIVKLIYKNK